MSEDDLCDLVMQGRNITELDHMVVDRAVDLEKMIQHLQEPGSLLTWRFPEESDISVLEFDRRKQATWFMPDEYRNMDIEGFLVNACPKENYQRLIEELQAFRSRNMMDILRVLKYVVDTLRSKNVLWGVGRGSSVASYALFLIGVHKIDSIKYNLDWQEFLR